MKRRSHPFEADSVKACGDSNRSSNRENHIVVILSCVLEVNKSGRSVNCSRLDLYKINKIVIHLNTHFNSSGMKTYTLVINITREIDNENYGGTDGRSEWL